MLLQLSPDWIHYVSSSTRKGITDSDPEDRDNTASSRLTYVCGSVPFSQPLPRRSADSLRRSCLSGTLRAKQSFRSNKTHRKLCEVLTTYQNLFYQKTLKKKV